MLRRFFTLLLIGAFTLSMSAQNNNLTKEQILAMSIEELSDLPLEDLMAAVETLGVSSVDELFAMIMNKNVASASKKEESAFTSPLSTTVVTRDEMRSWGVTTIEEALRLIPGIVVQEKTNGNYDVYIRGLNNVPDGQRLLYTENSNTLLMVDGRNVTDFVAGTIHFETLPIGIEDVLRVEVVRGPSSALYGQNAVQGVINIITEKPNATSNFVQGSFQVGNDKTAIAEVAMRKSFNDKVAAGITFNLQNRRRSTDKVYIPNRADMYYSENWTTIQNQMSGAPLAPGQKVIVPEVYEGGWIDVERIDNVRYYNAVTGKYYTINPAQYEYENMLGDPGMSRENYGTNAYLSFTPAADVRLDLTGGYQSSTILSTSSEDHYWAQGKRQSKSSYVNLDANVHDLHMNASYSDASTNFAMGVQGYKVKRRQFVVGADYDISLGNLSIRPAFQYTWYSGHTPYYTSGAKYMSGDGEAPDVYSDGYYYTYNDRGDEYHFAMTNFFTEKDAVSNTFAPSIRFDYKTDNNWRFIAAYRADKTDNPDRWNHSWQVAVNKEIGDRNFLRLSYGRAMRSACLMNSQSDFTYDRSTMSTPRYVYLKGSDHDLMRLDGIELGWRTRPTDRLLVDLEVFGSYSQDYGSLHAHDSYMSISKPDLAGYFSVAMESFKQGYANGLANQAAYQQAGMQAAQAAIAAGTLAPDQATAFVTDYVTEQVKGAVSTQLQADVLNPKQLLGNYFNANANIQYGNLPYKVKQFGASVNVDWIISTKLIAKFNVNVQRTIIDDYYQYKQNDVISSQVTQALGGVAGMTVDILNSLSAMQQKGLDPMAYMNEINDAQHGLTSQFAGLYDGKNVEDLNATYFAGEENYTGSVNGVSMSFHDLVPLYYALKYGIEIDKKTGQFKLGSSSVAKPELQSGHVHKATPSVYGMVGLIYKPINQLSFSAFANVMGSRRYTTTFSADEKLDPRFTMNLKVSYKPVEACEFFVNAHNLFNSEKQEFVYSDKLGGIYTVGVNFGF